MDNAQAAVRQAVAWIVLATDAAGALIIAIDVGIALVILSAALGRAARP